MHIGGIGFPLEHAPEPVHKVLGGCFSTWVGDARMPGAGTVEVLGIIAHLAYEALIGNAKGSDIGFGAYPILFELAQQEKMIRKEAARDDNLYIHVSQLANERGEIRSARPEFFHQHNSNTTRLQATSQITGELGGTWGGSMENGQALRVHMVS